MSEVYVVTAEPYHDNSTILAVFTTKEKAEYYVEHIFEIRNIENIKYLNTTGSEKYDVDLGHIHINVECIKLDNYVTTRMNRV